MNIDSTLKILRSIHGVMVMFLLKDGNFIKLENRDIMKRNIIIKRKNCSEEGKRFWDSLLNAKSQAEGDKIVEERKKVVISKIRGK